MLHFCFDFTPLYIVEFLSTLMFFWRFVCLSRYIPIRTLFTGLLILLAYICIHIWNFLYLNILEILKTLKFSKLTTYFFIFSVPFLLLLTRWSKIINKNLHVTVCIIMYSLLKLFCRLYHISAALFNFVEWMKINSWRGGCALHIEFYSRISKKDLSENFNIDMKSEIFLL